jgi:hypothetical protein
MSVQYPVWLPAMFNVHPWTEKTFDELYEIFLEDFIEDTASYSGRAVCFSGKMDHGKECIFWHLTCREYSANRGRFADLRRSERLPWARPTIDHNAAPEVRAWDYLEGKGNIRTYVWLKDHDYVLIMEKYSDNEILLVTAFWVENPNFRRKLERKYHQRI